ncbi:MAG: NADH-quinone oxidoreductase subunit NuoK [Planctomycetota bacterium]|jgi:NADH-quinone oxidoreductase subunit K|nr:NADH-quinone oxidoreductase subunit NuoK [Planctomycetota bacterium]
MLKYLILSAAMFTVGSYGVLARRNILIMLMSVELMLNGVNIALLAFARMHAGTVGAEYGQVFFLMVMAVAAAEVAVGLAILISLFRTRRTIDAGELNTLKG